MTRNGDPSTRLFSGLETVQSESVTTDGTPAPACTFRPAATHRNHRKPRADPSPPQFHPGHRATQWPISFFSGGFAGPGESIRGCPSGQYVALAAHDVRVHRHASTVVVSAVLARSATFLGRRQMLAQYQPSLLET